MVTHVAAAIAERVVFDSQEGRRDCPSDGFSSKARGGYLVNRNDPQQSAIKSTQRQSMEAMKLRMPNAIVMARNMKRQAENEMCRSASSGKTIKGTTESEKKG